MYAAAELGAFGHFVEFSVLEWRDGFATLSMPVKPFMLNRSGVLHGGMIMALLDAAGGYAGTFCTIPGNVRRGVTLNVNASFLRQVRTGAVFATANRVGGGRNVFFARVEIHDADREMVACGDCTYRYRANSADPAGFTPEPELPRA